MSCTVDGVIMRARRLVRSKAIGAQKCDSYEKVLLTARPTKTEFLTIRDARQRALDTNFTDASS